MCVIKDRTCIKISIDMSENVSTMHKSCTNITFKSMYQKFMVEIMLLKKKRNLWWAKTLESTEGSIFIRTVHVLLIKIQINMQIELC